MSYFKINFQAKHLNQTFIEIVKENNYVTKNKIYDILDWTNNDNYIRQCKLIDIRLITVEDIDTQLAYLDKNCSLEIYKNFTY